MLKLTLKLNDRVLDEFTLKEGDTKIGRKPSNDIVVDNLAISGSHANIFAVGEHAFVQDLNSTNGTFVNGKRVAKHHLAHGDVIGIGKHLLVFTNSKAIKAESFAKTVAINPLPEKGGRRQAALFILSGPNSGKRIDITKTVTQLGSTGKPAGIVTETPKGYTLSAAPGGEMPKLNGNVIPGNNEPLRNGDIIEVADTRVQFYLK
jgi:pSer/pThr/pTyr-binding forkhead associated (FHA) protein